MIKINSTSTKSTALFMFAIRILRLFVTIITLPLTALYFGISLERDSWILVSTYITTFGLLIWGAIDETFRAKFVEIKEKEGENSAILKASSLGLFTIIVSIFLCCTLYLFGDQISTIIDNSENKHNVKIILTLIYFLIPTLLLNQIISLGLGILNSYEIYFIPEFTGLFASLVNLFLILFLAPYVGIFSLVISQYISILLVLIFLIYYFKKQKIYLGQIMNMKTSHVKVFIVFALPFFFPYFAGQVNNIFEKIVANSLGPGSVSILDYSKQFSSMLQVVISSVITTVMLPLLSNKYSNNEKKLFSDILGENIAAVFIIMSATVTILVGATDQICDLFFNKADITHDELKLLVNLTRWYGFGLIGIILYLLFGIALLASGKSKIYASIGVCCQIAVFVINLLFSKRIGLVVFPISILLSHMVAAIILGFYIDLINKKSMILKLMKKLVVFFFMSLVIYLVNLFPISHVSLYQLVFDFIILVFLILFFSNSLEFNISKFGTFKK
jgi:peptidoglycan biosynthesis protein MviN/MurJ (putative lipid II flippase)